VALAINNPTDEVPGAVNGITASRSLDGGISWEPPQVILTESLFTPPFPINDKQTVTADPIRPGHAYAVWDRVRCPSEHQALAGALHSYFEASSFRADGVLARTTGGGESWEPARSIMPTNASDPPTAASDAPRAINDSGGRNAEASTVLGNTRRFGEIAPPKLDQRGEHVRRGAGGYFGLDCARGELHHTGVDRTPRRRRAAWRAHHRVAGDGCERRRSADRRRCQDRG